MRCMRLSMILGVAGLLMLAGRTDAKLYVVQVGDGTAALTNSSTAAFVKVFDETGSPPLTETSTINLPIAASGANQPLTMSGTAASEGFISLSGNGNYLMLGGYGIAPGTTAVPTTASATVPRVVGRIDIAAATVDTTTALTDAYSGTGGNNSPLRSVASTNGVDIWTAGTGQAVSTVSTAGVRYTTLGSTTSTQLSTAPTNTRVVEIVNGQLFVGTGSAGFLGPSTVGTGTPTEASQTTTLLSGFPTVSGGTGNPQHSPYDYWFKDADTVYVADDGSAANGGGIQKWTQSAGTWSLQYILLNDAPAGSFVGTATTGARGLTGVVDGADTVLYATTSAGTNKLVKIIDAGIGSASVDLATAPTNTAFRGVQFVPTVAPPANNADFNSDNVVDGADFLIWQAGYGLIDQTGKTTGNANTDSVVDDLDFAEWKAKFGGPPAAATAAGVPEPGALVLAALGLAGAFAVRRRRK